jgi:hypothetical protein
MKLRLQQIDNNSFKDFIIEAIIGIIKYEWKKYKIEYIGY